MSEVKPPVHIITGNQIERVKEPRFSAHFTVTKDGKVLLQNITTATIVSPDKLEKLTKKAESFITYQKAKERK